MGIALSLFSAFDEPLGRIRPLSATHEEGLDGTDTLTIETLDAVEKGQRVVWRDVAGTWHEHVVDSTETRHDGKGKPITTATCINSICETYGDYIDDKRPTGSASAILSAYLSAATGTRWALGTTDAAGSYSSGVSAYHTSLRKAIAQLCERCGGELETTIAVDGSGVVSRKVGIRAMRNATAAMTPRHRFEYGRNLVGVTRNVASDEVVTALYGYGKGEGTEDGGYGRRLDLSSVNGGSKYVADDAARALYGKPGADGSKSHRFGVVVFEDCELADELLEATRAELQRVNHPRVSYECPIADLRAVDARHPVVVGEPVQVVDDELGLRSVERVTSVRRDLMGGTTGTVSVGERDSEIVRTFTKVAREESRASDTASTVDSISGLTPDYLSSLTGALNAGGYSGSIVSAGAGGGTLGDGWKHEVVTTLPDSTDSKTIYFVTGT